jgi:hypothetical protein
LTIDIAFLAKLITISLEDTMFPNVERAVPLLLSTAAVESGLQNVRQIGGGPARGVFQMEPSTAKDMHAWLLRDPKRAQVVVSRCGVEVYTDQALSLNMVFQIFLARTVFYVRDHKPLPDIHDVEAQWATYKQHYNTAGGATTHEKYLSAYHRLVEPYLKGHAAGV